MRKIYESDATRQAAYRGRGRVEHLSKKIALKLDQARLLTDELGEIEGTEYVVAAIPVPPLLAQSILAREKSQGIPAADQVKTFFLAGAEVIHRAIDVALARGIVTPDDQSKLVDRLASEVARFSGEVELKREEGAPN